MFADLIDVASRRALLEEEASAAMELLADGVPSSAEIRDFLLTPALSLESVDASTLTGLVRVVRRRATPVTGINRRPLFDTCGTGGGAGTFNISTAVSLCLAASGLAVAKHGNRAVASNSGSADVLEALRVPIDLDAASAARAINETGFAFLFAQKYHGAFKYVQPVRRELAAEGRRTAFNFIGPLANPASPTHQIVGVFLPDKIGVIAEVLRRLGTEAALVVCGDSIDEISLSGETKAMLLRNGALTEMTFYPRDFGIAPSSESLSVAGAQESAETIRDIFSGRASSAADVVIINTAAGFFLAGETDLRVAADRARALLAGPALDFLNRLAHGT